MLNWKTVFLKQNTFSTDASHTVDCLNSLFFAESFFVLKILTVDLWLKPFNSCIKCFHLNGKKFSVGYTGVPWGGNSFVLTPAGFCRTNSISVPWLASVSVACHDFECLDRESLCVHTEHWCHPPPPWLYSAPAMQDPALALMLNVALAFRSALTCGHWGQQSPSPALDLCSLGQPVEPFAVCLGALMDKEGVVQTRVWRQPPSGQ